MDGLRMAHIPTKSHTIASEKNDGCRLWAIAPLVEPTSGRHWRGVCRSFGSHAMTDLESR
jgi:hypothetical protein